MRRCFVPVDLDVLRSAAGGDDVEFSVAIEVGEAEVFAGHPFVVHYAFTPACKRVVKQGKQPDTAALAAPADNDFGLDIADDIGDRKGVPLSQLIGEDVSTILEVHNQ